MVKQRLALPGSANKYIAYVLPMEYNETPVEIKEKKTF